MTWLLHIWILIFRACGILSDQRRPWLPKLWHVATHRIRSNATTASNGCCHALLPTTNTHRLQPASCTMHCMGNHITAPQQSVHGTHVLGQPSALASCLSDSFKWSSAMVCMVRCVVHEWSSALPALTCCCSMGRNSIEREKETYWKVIRPFFSTFEESLSKIWHTCNQTVLLLQSLF